MKTLLFTIEYPPFKGGIANYYGNLAYYWPINEKIVVLHNNRGQLIRQKGFLRWWPALGILKRKIKESKIDYVLVGQVLPLGTVAYLLSLFKPLDYAVFLHGMDLSYARRSFRKRCLLKCILGRANKIICANNYTAEKLKKLYPSQAEKVFVANPGISAGVPNIDYSDIEKINEKYNLQNKIVLFSLGRLVRRKGVDKTIQAFVNISDPIADKLVYFIAGEGPDEKYLRNLIPEPFLKNIIFLGKISDTKKWLYLKRSDIFIMPSRDINGDFEGFGIVYLEANLVSRPVIAGQTGGVADAVVDNYTGLLVDPEDVSSIRKAIVDLANNEEKRKKLGKQGRERALKEFNWEKQSALIVKIIKTN